MLTPEATVLLLCWHSSPPLSTAKAPLPLLCRYRLIPQPTRYIPVSFSFLGETLGRSSPPGRKVHQRRARGSPPRVREHKLSSRLIPVPASNHLRIHLKLRCRREHEGDWAASRHENG